MNIIQIPTSFDASLPNIIINFRDINGNYGKQIEIIVT